MGNYFSQTTFKTNTLIDAKNAFTHSYFSFPFLMLCLFILVGILFQ